MSEEPQPKIYPDATFKVPRPFGNLFSSDAYPKWEPIDTVGKTKKVFKTTFYTTAGAYAWLYFWKRTTFKLETPLAVIGFLTIGVATKSAVANLREVNDGWNVFWGSAVGNLVVLTAAFKSMPAKHKILTGVAGSTITAFVSQWSWAQSLTSPGKDMKHYMANEQVEGEIPKQGFWEVMRRRPLSQTVEDLGVGRGIFKP